MKVNAVSVSTTNMERSTEFYRALGFEFEPFDEDAMHVTSVDKEGSARLMIDDVQVIREIIGEDPRPGNSSGFAIEFNSAGEVDETAGRVAAAGFTVAKAPWDAFWGQRYAIVEDPEGYKIDLYAMLPG